MLITYATDNDIPYHFKSTLIPLPVANAVAVFTATLAALATIYAKATCPASGKAFTHENNTGIYGSSFPQPIFFPANPIAATTKLILELLN